MTHIYVEHNFCQLETRILVNENEIEKSSKLFKLVGGKQLHEWIVDFPQILRNELNDNDFSIEFCGIDLEWDDFEDIFDYMKNVKALIRLDLRLVDRNPNDIISDDSSIWSRLPETQKKNFSIYVIGAEDSGKSTLINSLLAKRVIPLKSKVGIATITEILDTGKDKFTALAYGMQGEMLWKVDEFTDEAIYRLYSDENVYRIVMNGNIPFFDSQSIAMKFVDVPSMNKFKAHEYMDAIYQGMCNDSMSIILFVLNGTALGINDNSYLLNYVINQLEKSNRNIRDRFIFVLNKMDCFNPEEEDIGKAIQSAKVHLLSKHGIENPQIFPCSANVALNIRTYLSEIDIDNLTRDEELGLPLEVRDILATIDNVIDYESMHLEQYSVLVPSAKMEIGYKLKQAEEREDTKEQALIHCGIYSIEAAIVAYMDSRYRTR